MEKIWQESPHQLIFSNPHHRIRLELYRNLIVDTDDGAVIKRVDDDHTLYSVNPAVPYPSKNEQNSLVIRGRVLGVVASSDRPAKEDAGLLEELFVDEIREFNEEHGIRDW